MHVCVCVCVCVCVSVHVCVCLLTCDLMNCSMPGFPVLHHLLELAQTHVHQVGDATQSNHLILCHPLHLLPSIFSSIRVFPNKLVIGIRWPEYWSFSCRVRPYNEYSGLITFRINWFDLLAVQGTLKNIFQHHCSKATILRCSYGPTLTSIHEYWKNLSVD